MSNKQWQIMRKIPQKGDPELNVLIPKVLKTQLEDFAKLSKHKLADEVIRRLTATFIHEEAFGKLEKLLSSQFKDGC